MCKNKRCANYYKLYIFKSPLPIKFKYAKIFAKFSKPKSVFKKNLNCANSLLRHFLCKNLCNISLHKKCNLLPYVVAAFYRAITF